ncbi:Glycosyl transferase family 2 [Pseudobutyrivibrio sp. 49]|uniref:glycosyltransferase n=1 Tax=Pseudobutyrivibrio sp. 49 TaxID=1855344 RepID=UPI0008923F88|nr:glycosyltransferase [Pseudobutyrivibrio sp. 49]SDI80818.1 Glycosyl transferase family 2 [Pseudobutyrivibrio sp. 49]
MNNKPKTKLLTISLLCCGRPDTTERCLKSLMPIRKAIDSELQVIDTGCSKETRKIIEKYADEVFEFSWVNDFAAARNFQLDQANGKMFLYIDDDEWFLDTTYIVEFFKDPKCTTYNVGGYFQRNYLDFEGKEYEDIEVMRMCRVDPDVCFKGKIHEYIYPGAGNTMFMDARAGHFGYVYESEEDNVKHSLRNIPLLKEMMEEEPDELRWPYQLAQEYKAIKYNQELLDLCMTTFRKTGETKEDIKYKYRGSFACGVVIAMARLEMLDEILDFYKEVKEKDLIFPLPMAKLAFYAAKVYFIRDENDKCEEEIKFYFDVYEKVGNDRGLMFIQGGIFSSDTFNETNMNLMYCYAMTCGLRKNDYGPLVHYYRRITWDSKVVRLNRGFVTTLVAEAAKVGYKKEIRDVLNKFFTSEGFRNLLEKIIDDIVKEFDEEGLLNIRNAFKTTDGEKEMNLFMDVRILERQIANVDSWDSYKQLLDVLGAYAQAVVKWQRAHDSLFPSENPSFTLAQETKLGCDINDFIECESKDVPKALSYIKDMIGRRPMMNPAVSQLADMYGRKQMLDNLKAKDPAKFQEMYDLEDAILRQIAELDAAGQVDEAVATYQELIMAIKNTYGVETLHI